MHHLYATDHGSPTHAIRFGAFFNPSNTQYFEVPGGKITIFNPYESHLGKRIDETEENLESRRVANNPIVNIPNGIIHTPLRKTGVSTPSPILIVQSKYALTFHPVLDLSTTPSTRAERENLAHHLGKISLSQEDFRSLEDSERLEQLSEVSLYSRAACLSRGHGRHTLIIADADAFTAAGGII